MVTVNNLRQPSEAYAALSPTTLQNPGAGKRAPVKSRRKKFSAENFSLSVVKANAAASGILPMNDPREARGSDDAP